MCGFGVAGQSDPQESECHNMKTFLGRIVTLLDSAGQCVIVSKWGGGWPNYSSRYPNIWQKSWSMGQLQSVSKALWNIGRKLPKSSEIFDGGSPTPYFLNHTVNHWSCCQQVITIACKKVTSIFFLCGDVYFHLRVPSFLKFSFMS